jgi:ribA/ribD-fused uncharacterized protein
MYKIKFKLDGLIWPAVENYFQAQKVRDDRLKDIFTLILPFKARVLGNNISLSEDFENNKLSIMKKAIYAKFSQNEDLKELLLLTGNVELIEYAPWDRKGSYWGVNADGVGENHTGKILMEVREEL